MTKNGGTISIAVEMLIKAVALAARFAGRMRERHLEKLITMSMDEKSTEIEMLRARVEELETMIGFWKSRANKKTGKPHYSLRERLHVIFLMELLQVPRRQVTKHFGVARSTLYRWLRTLDDDTSKRHRPWNKTPDEIAELVWQIAKDNISWSRFRISNQLKILGVFLAASTVRNILSRPRPRGPASPRAESIPPTAPRKIPAFYPNHVWSIDHTIVFRGRCWLTYVFVAIDHFSRKVVAVTPVEGPNAAWTLDVLENIFRQLGPPRHLITDQQGVFTSYAFTRLMETWNIKQRFGAVGKHGSISVTERVIKTLKYEWLHRVPYIRNFTHLEQLCSTFVVWHNGWRPHMTLDGFRPEDFYGRELPERVDRDAKVVPMNIERKVFDETKVVGYRLRDAA